MLTLLGLTELYQDSGQARDGGKLDSKVQRLEFPSLFVASTHALRTGKGKKDRPLLRPIICICNDLYAPNLRPLRPLARIIRFTPPTNVMLVHRLRSICVEEGLGADSKNLTMLTEIAEGDLRSCLNTLQVSLLVSFRFLRMLTSLHDSSSNVGARSSTRKRSRRRWSE